MIRILITIALPLIAPTVVYFIWLWARRKRRNAIDAGEELPLWQELPWAWLVISGAVLALVTLVAMTYSGWNGDMTGTYTPPRFQDGQVVPGRFGDQE